MILSIYLIFIIAIIGAVVAYLVLDYENKKENFSTISSLNSQVDEIIKNGNFNKTKEYFLENQYTVNKEEVSRQKIIVDDENKKICFIDYENKKVYFFEFKDVLNYEIYNNGNNVSTGGGIGGRSAAIFGATTEKNCKELSLIIRLKDLKVPQIKYNIIYKTTFNLGLAQTSSNYQICYRKLQEVVSMLEVIINENKKS